MIMVATAAGDASNIVNFDPEESIPEWRLAPHDNNIGVRNLFAVDGAGWKQLLVAFDGMRFYVKNPHDTRARMVIKPILPALLAERGWRLEFTTRDTFPLAARAGRDVVMRLKAGKRFTASEVRRARDRNIDVEVFANDILVGGVTYTLDAAVRAPRRRRNLDD